MDRKQFLRGCATGLCACATACLPIAAFGETAKPEDWRLPFAQKRYAKLIGIMSERMDAVTASASLQELGTYCAAQQDKTTEAFRGKPDAFIAELAKSGSTVTHDAATNTYLASYDPHGDCTCPLNSLKAKTPGLVCDCSLGWMQHTWGIVLGKAPKVELKEAVLRGGKVCKFQITPA